MSLAATISFIITVGSTCRKKNPFLSVVVVLLEHQMIFSSNLYVLKSVAEFKHYTQDIENNHSSG